MKDMLGHELEIGDTVVLNRLYGNSYKQYKMIAVKVMRLTEKTVIYSGKGYNDEAVQGKMVANKVVKVAKV